MRFKSACESGNDPTRIATSFHGKNGRSYACVSYKKNPKKHSEDSSSRTVLERKGKGKRGLKPEKNI
ncbi:hypothetical protein DLM78_16840 [Leptospira stimsonii]|uniref:Uncharacterized protein n=1 Tax=Leptospira stimsonii TaxID=2202203 RepID=A0A8B3CPE1_9LEPT|nr:hypothetical protein DLM78_16840 [Leptospira stimsonii]